MEIVEGAFRYSPDDVEEWENPWGEQPPAVDIVYGFFRSGRMPYGN